MSEFIYKRGEAIHVSEVTKADLQDLDTYVPADLSRPFPRSCYVSEQEIRKIVGKLSTLSLRQRIVAWFSGLRE